MKSGVYGILLILLLFLIAGCGGEENIVIQKVSEDMPEEPKEVPIEVADEPDEVPEEEEPVINIIRDEEPDEVPEEEPEEVPIIEKEEEKVSKGDLKIRILNIKKGNAIHLETPTGKHVMINVGPKENADLVGFELRRMGIDDIDTVIITDMLDDNLGALPELAEDYTIKDVYDNGIELSASTHYQQYRESLGKDQYHTVETDMDIDIDPFLDVSLIVPYDTTEKISKETETILVKVRYGKFSILFTGNCGFDCEPFILKKDLKADAFVMPEHGVKTATSNNLIDAIEPQVALIQNGEELYIKTSTYLKNSGIKIYDTYNDKADIVIESDGNTFEVKAER